MKDVVVDTNVAVVANDRDGQYAAGCALSCIERLRVARSRERIIVDVDWEILTEYGRNLRSRGQPGPGDAFYNHVLRHIGNVQFVRLIGLERNIERVFEAFPDDEKLTGFDPSDRKFVAAAIVARAAVLNAVDSDWRQHEAVLQVHGVKVEFVCGRAAATRANAP